MNLFNTVPVPKIKRNVFNLSHEFDFTMKMGTITPIFCEEVVPGDSFMCDTEFLMRFSPLIAPVMSRVNVFTQFYFVPLRLIWDDFEDFITGGEDGSALPQKPYFKYNGYYVKSGYSSIGGLGDFLGVPPTQEYITGEGENIDALPFRAYQLIYNEYWRNENLQPEIDFSRSSGQVLSSDIDKICVLRKHNWEKDYFTSALPWTQKGPDVRLPLTGDADVINAEPGIGTRFSTTNGAGITSDPADVQGSKDSDTSVHLSVDGLPLAIGNVDGSTTLRADMSSVTSATINELRRAIQLQRWFETQARVGGSRYIENTLGHFGVRSSDARLQRPEFLGGSRTPISISEVLQTSASQTEAGSSGADISPQGNMAGHGLSVGSSRKWKRFFEEHGLVIGVMFVQPRTSYQQGLPKMFSRFDKFDYLWPEFAHLGEQPVLNKEIFLNNGDDSTNDGIFGYQSRYAEYKYKPNRVAGDFRDSLSFWHMGRIFSQRPGLNSEFVTADPTTRIFAVEDENVDKIYVQLYHNWKAIRPLPKYGIPKL